MNSFIFERLDIFKIYKTNVSKITIGINTNKEKLLKLKSKYNKRRIIEDSDDETINMDEENEESNEEEESNESAVETEDSDVQSLDATTSENNSENTQNED